MVEKRVPTYDKMMNPLLEALRVLGGSGTIDELASKVSEVMKIPEGVLAIPQDPKRGGRSKFEYRLAWTRTYLKKYGLIENSERGVWSLTPEGRKAEKVDSKDVVRVVKAQLTEASREKETGLDDEDNFEGVLVTWEEELLDVLLDIEPEVFERLIQRVLRESGFVQVEVTGRSGDGGLDGKGIAKLSGLLGFHVIFQCKRYKGSVGAGEIRDFRGAMVGRADKGLMVTTGSFTRDAIREASRDGAPPIDLIDGEELVGLLKRLSLGVTTKIAQVEEVQVNRDWFSSL